MLGAKAQQRQRQPDLVVEVAFVPERSVARRKRATDRLLRRGLRDAAGNADDHGVEPAPPGRGDGSERREGVGDTHDRDVAEHRWIRDRP